MAGPPLLPARLLIVRQVRVGVPSLFRLFEASDQAVEARHMAFPPPADARIAQRPGRGERPRGILLRAGGAGKRQGARGERSTQRVGGKALRDPVEKRQRRLAGTGIGDRDAGREGAGDGVLARELPDERRVNGAVAVEDLDVVERDPVAEDRPEDLPDLVLLADRAEEARLPRDRLPGAGRIRGERDELSSRELLQERAFQDGELGEAGKEIACLRGRRRTRLEGFQRAAKDFQPIQESSGLEGLLVTPEHVPKLTVLAAVGEGDLRQRGRRQSCRAQLLERVLERAMESGAVEKPPEVGILGEDLGASLLDERERLRPREQLPPGPRQRGADQGMGEMPHRLHPQVDPGWPDRARASTIW